MSKLANGCKVFNCTKKHIIVTSDLTRIQIPPNCELMPLNCNSFPLSLRTQLEELKILLNADETRAPPVPSNDLLIDNVTFKNIVVDKISLIFEEFLKNSSNNPVITIDCPLDSVIRLLGLITEKYHANSINPIIKIFIRDNLEAFIAAIAQFLANRESIEKNNVILIVTDQYYDKQYFSKLLQRLTPLKIYLYFESVSSLLARLHELELLPEVSILLEFEESLLNFDIAQLVHRDIFIDDDSLFRLLTAFRQKIDLKISNSIMKTYIPRHLKKHIFQPYCSACTSKLFIEGDGNLYSCNLGYKNADLIAILGDKPLEQLLKSDEFQQKRKRIELQSLECQKTCPLSYFCSGCLYMEQKCIPITNLFKALLDQEGRL